MTTNERTPTQGTTDPSRTTLEGATRDPRSGRVLDFGDPSGERTAFGPESAALTPLTGITPLRLTGPDRHDFLHGQVSNEVRRLERGRTNEALLLNVRGHALALMRVARRDDDLYVAVEGGAGAFVLERLRAHIVFDQVTIEDLTGTIDAFTVQGGRARTVVEAMFGIEAPAEGEFLEVPFASAKVLVAASPRTRFAGYDVHVLSRDAGSLFGALRDAGARPAGETALTGARIRAGIALPETEAGEGVLPQEAGLERAISYRKGCYLGQEIMARIEARGTLRRSLAGVVLHGTPPAGERDIVLSSGKVVGRLGACERAADGRAVGLAVVRSDVDPEETLQVGGVALERTSLPFAE